jgi:hypothetical protein
MMIRSRPSLQALVTDLYQTAEEKHASGVEGPEEKNHSGVDIEKFISELSVKSPVEKIFSATTTGNSIIFPILFVNFMRIFWNVQAQLSHKMETSLYYRCEYMPEIRKAITYDSATLRAEGAGLTTTTAGFGALFAVFAAMYQLANHARRKKQFRNERNLTQQVDLFIRYLNLPQPEQEKKLRSFLLDAPIPKLKKLLQKKYYGVDANVVQEIQQLTSGLQRFADDLAWYREELNTNYFLPIVGISTIPAFIVTFIAALKFHQHSTCSTFPLIAYLLDSCDVKEQYENLSLLTYFWDVLSVTGLSVYCTGLLARAATSYPALKSLRPWYYENVHQKYFASNPDKWVFKKLAWAFSSYLFAPLILTYAFIAAMKLANEYAASADCPSFLNLLMSIYSNAESDDYHCSPAEKSMGVAGFLGDFEIVKVDLLFFSLMCFSYVLAGMAERCFNKKSSTMTLEEIQVVDDRLTYGKKILAITESISKKSWDLAIAGCVLIGIVQFVPIVRFADSILHNDLEVFRNLNVSLPTNSSSNDMYSAFAKSFCPYDNLTAIILEYTNSTQYNLTEFLSQHLPLRLVHNDTAALCIAQACKNHDIASAYFYNIAGIDTGCDPLLVTRSIGGFVGPYWLGISFISGGIYVIATSTQLLHQALKLIRSYCKPASTAEVSVVNADADSVYHRLRGQEDDVKAELSPGRNGMFHHRHSPQVNSRSVIIAQSRFSL